MDILKLLWLRAFVLLGIFFSCFSVWQTAKVAMEYVPERLLSWLVALGMGI